MNIIKKIASFFVVGIIVIGIFMQTDLVRNFAKEMLIQAIEKDSGYTVDIEDLRIFPTFQLFATDIILSHQEKNLLAIHKISAAINPFSLLSGSLHFHSLEVNGVDYFIHNTSHPNHQYASTSSPLRIEIDSFFIENFPIKGLEEEESKTAFDIYGSLKFDPEKTLLNASLKCVSTVDKAFWILAETQIKNGEGSFQINTSQEIHLAAEFAVHEQRIRVNRFHASYDSYSLDGNFSLTHEGIFDDSAILLTTGDLSKMLPIKGFLYGEGKILGSLWSPELNLQIFSDQLLIKSSLLENVQARLVSRHLKKGIEGNISISFIKDQQPYNFSGKVFWENDFGPFPKRFKAETNLTEITQFFNIETAAVTGLVAIEIEFSNHNIRGKALLSNGHFESYELGCQMTDIVAIIEGDLHGLALTAFQAKDAANGHYSGRGSMELDFTKNLPFNFIFTAENALFLQLDMINAVASGDLRLHGTIAAAELEGSITVHSASFNVPEDDDSIVEGVEVTYINQSSDDLPTSYKTHQSDIPLTLNLKVVAPKRIMIKGASWNSEWKGEALITGSLSAPKVNGELNVVGGKYKLRGRKLDMNKGSITFGGELDKKTMLYVILSLNIERYTIEIIAKGPVNNPAISFRSNPPLSRKEILSWLLFNKDISDISEFQGDRLDKSILTLSSDADEGPDALTKLGESLGIDRIDISGSPNANQVSFELGKYVSENTYISISRKPTGKAEATLIGTGTQIQDQQDQSNRIGIETNLGKNFKFQAEVDEDQAGQINLIWKKDY